MASSYEVTAIPHTQYDFYWRAGKKWSRTPTIVTVVDKQVADLGPNEITAEQLKVLQKDPQMKVGDSSGSAPSETPPSDDAESGRRRGR